jgi:intein-encoded DNA endonuclease-like protein
MRKFSEEQEKEIIDLYCNQNVSIHQIVKKFHCRSEFIKDILTKNHVHVGVGLRKYQPTSEELNIIKKMIREHASIQEIKHKLHKDVTVISRIIKENNLQLDYIPVNRNLDHHFFDLIDSEEKAWLLGFLYTDGSVRNNNPHKYQIRLSIKISDEPIIDKIIQLLHLDNKKIYDNREGKECVGIEFRSEQIFNKVSEYGVIPNKTYSSTSLNIDKIPEHLQRHYVRGLFDGDGGLGFTGNIYDITCDFTAHYRSEVKEFQMFIDEQINKQIHNKIKTTESKSRCAWRGRQQVIKICSYLYDNSTIYLPRKKEKYLWIKSTLADKLD